MFSNYSIAMAALDPTIWGPYVWGAIHSIAIGAPDSLDATQKNAYRLFFAQLPTIIPCHKCQQHLYEHLALAPVEPHLEGGGKAIFAWSVALHNSVNKTLGKKEFTIEEARAYWKQPIAAGHGSGQSFGRRLPHLHIGLLVASAALVLIALVLFRTGRSSK